MSTATIRAGLKEGRLLVMPLRGNLSPLRERWKRALSSRVLQQKGDLATVLEYRITIRCLLPDNAEIKRVFKSSHGLARACQPGDYSGLTKRNLSDLLHLSRLNAPDVMGSSSEVAWTNGGASCKSAPEKSRRLVQSGPFLPSAALLRRLPLPHVQIRPSKLQFKEPIDQRMSMDLTRMAKEDT